MRRAVIYLGLAAACIITGGLLLARTGHMSAAMGLYCGLGTATTVGCDPSYPAGEIVVSVLLMVTALPLFALGYGSLSAAHLRRRLDEHKTGVIAAVQDEMKATRDHVTRQVGDVHRRLEDQAELIRAAGVSNGADH